MMIQQIEHKYSEEHIMESTTVNKKIQQEPYVPLSEESLY